MLLHKNNQNLDTPCFTFDESEFTRGVRGFREAIEEAGYRVKIGFSVKTNSLPYAMGVARKLGCMCEVVSRDEYELAKACGYQPWEIIYNGPMKSKETFLECVMHGGIVNLETKRELDWLMDLPKCKDYKIGVRLNINISHVSPEDADGEDDNSRFGFSDESDEFSEALAEIVKLQNVSLAGLHIHRTTHSRSPLFYKHSIEYAAKVIKKYNLNLDYLDVGGGYFGIFPNKPTFADYAAAFDVSLRETGLSNLTIIIEPGNALVASCFSFLTSVVDVKQIDDKTRFVTTDGSRNDVDPFFRKTDYLKQIIPSDDSDRPILPKQIVAGCTCLEYDRLFTLSDAPELRVGDKILYNNVGAYTMTLSPQFIRLWPRVYAITEAGEIKEVRRRASAEDIMKLNTYQ